MVEDLREQATAALVVICSWILFAARWEESCAAAEEQSAFIVNLMGAGRLAGCGVILLLISWGGVIFLSWTTVMSCSSLLARPSLSGLGHSRHALSPSPPELLGAAADTAPFLVTVIPRPL